MARKKTNKDQKTSRYSIVTSNEEVKTWLEAQNNRSASIDLLIRFFIANTGMADSDIYDALFSMTKGIFGGFEANKSGSNVNAASSDSPAANPEPTSAKNDDPAPDSSPVKSEDTKNEDATEEKKKKRKPVKRVKPAADKINGLDYFNGK